jgi:amidase
MADLDALDATAQRDAVRSGEVTPAELVEAAIARIERVDGDVNAVPIRLFERALAAARATARDAPLPGIPLVVKDTVPTDGDPWHRGMVLLRDSGHRGPFDAHAVALVRRAGAAIVGKSNVPELEGGVSTEPAVYGATRNPWALERSAGGSSGGSAAAVAAGLVPVAIGVDGGGSIRIPSSVCGVVGLKPSRGRTTLFPMYTEEGLSTAGPIARSVRDCALLLDMMTGSPAGDHFAGSGPSDCLSAQAGADPGRLRIGIWSPQPDGVTAHPDCVTAVSRAAQLLEGLGNQAEVSHPAELDTHFFRRPEFVITGACYIAYQVDEIAAKIGRPLTDADVEQVTWAAYTAGATVSATALQQAYAYNRTAAVRYASWFDESGNDLLLTPTIAVPPYPLGALTPTSPEAPWPDVAPWVPFTPHANLAGLPAITLPLHSNEEGLPIGVQLVARHGREDLLVQIGAQLEAAQPWAHRLPQAAIRTEPRFPLDADADAAFARRTSSSGK